MANSGTVTAGSAALASQYNNLRDDVLNVSTGHTHTGASENGAKVAATGVSSGTAALGAVLTADGSGAAAFLAASASGGILKYEEYTSSGSFIIPASASSSAIMILNVVGAGAGGNSGARTGAGTSSAGGAGGVGGGVGDFVFLSSAFGTPGGTVTVTIGAGGAGGASKTTAGVGNLGSEGGTTSFGTVNFKGGGIPSSAINSRGNYRFDSDFIIITGSNPTQNVASGSALPGGGKAPINDLLNSSKYSFSAIGIGEDSFCSAWDTAEIAGGGGGGGGAGYLGTAVRGGNGGKCYDSVSDIVTTDNKFQPRYTFGNGASGGTVATVGSSVAAGLLDGAGGGGGGAAGSAGSGGNGAIGGGGGGGGGGLAQNSGAGGTGGGGRVRVWVIG